MSLGRSLRLIPSVLVGGLAWLNLGPAKADLNSDAELLAARGKMPNRAIRLPPRLGERGNPLVIFLPQEVFAGSPSSCVSVTVLGPSSAHFTVRAAGAGTLPDLPDHGPISSLAGLTELVYCGARKSRLAVLIVEMRSPRAVLETVIVEGATPVTPATDSLPHRDPGPLEPAPPFGSGSGTPIAERLQARQRRALLEGQSWESPRKLEKTSAFGGAYAEHLEAGCHEFGFVLDVPSRSGAPRDADSAERSALSVEPELAASQTLIGRQRGEGTFTQVALCAGEAGRVKFNVSFAPRQAELWLTHASAPLPQHLPNQLGPPGKAAVAALLTRHSTRLTSDAIDLALGVTGPTWMPIAIEPGACYVAALVRIGGSAQSLSLAAQVGRAWTRNRSRDELGTMVGFCAGENAQARVEAEARGAGIVWLYALWQVGRLPLGAPSL